MPRDNEPATKHALFIMDSFLTHYLTIGQFTGYAIAFLGMIFEGEIILFSVAFLARAGVVDFSGMAVAIVAGVFVGDLYWYWIGAVIARRWRWVEKIVRAVCEPFDEVIARRPFRTILISKFIYNLGHLTIARAAMIRIGFRQFVKSDFPAALVWVVIVGGLGYFSGGSLGFVRHVFHYAEITLLFAVVIFFLVWKYATDFLKKWLQ